MNAGSFSGTFRLDRSRNAALQVYDHLRELIVTLALMPGTPLSRSELAGYFNLSPMPIRDALFRLSGDGLVEIFPQYLTRVKAIDVDSARQGHVLRLSVELEVVHGLAQSPNPRMEQQLLAKVAMQQACLQAGDLDGFAEHDVAFHQTMFQAAQLMDIWHLIRNASGHLDRLRRLHLPVNGKADSILSDHADIARAIGLGDPSLAQATLRRHLSGTLSELNALRERYPGYMLPVTVNGPENL